MIVVTALEVQVLDCTLIKSTCCSACDVMPKVMSIDWWRHTETCKEKFSGGLDSVKAEAHKNESRPSSPQPIRSFSSFSFLNVNDIHSSLHSFSIFHLYSIIDFLVGG